MNTIKTNPYKAVSFVESAVESALQKAGSLIADIKYDGVRLNLLAYRHVDLPEYVYSDWLSRVSKPIPALQHLSGQSARWAKFLADDRQIYPDGLMIDGEAMVKGVDFNTGSGLLRSKWLSKKNVAFTSKPDFEIPKGMGKVPFELSPQKLKVVVYSVLPLADIKSGSDIDTMNCIMPYHVDAVIACLNDHFPEIEWVKTATYEVYDITHLHELYQWARDNGHEGLVVKDPLGNYKRGKKTGWWKMKPECEADGVITGLVWGTKGKANEGKVIGFEVLLESGRVVNATNIQQAMMEELTEEVKEATLSKCGVFSPYGIGGNDSCVINPYEGWACQISYMEETPDGSLRHPSFVCFRGTEDNPTEKI